MIGPAMSTNEQVAEILSAIGDLLELQGERFKPEAYRRAARSILGAGEDLRAIQARGELSEIPAVGEAIQKKIEEFLATGRIHYLGELQAAVPAGVVALMRLPGVGPKTAARFARELEIDSPEALRRAIERGRLNGVKGFGARKIEKLKMAASPASAAPAGRQPLRVAAELADRVLACLVERASVRELQVAGSLRRRRATVGDIDILATSEEPRAVIAAFAQLPGVREVVVQGETKCTIVHETGVQIDLRVVAPESFGAALQYFTGSKDHNVRLRALAKDQGLRINEYGVSRGEERIAGRTEEEVYRTVGLPWIPPEIRENQGEFEAAAADRLPHLLEPSDLRGELHVHLPLSPAEWSLGRWVEAARARRLRYFGVVLPEPALVPGSASGPERLRKEWKAIAGGEGPRLLVGAEVPLGTIERAIPVYGAVDYLVLDASAGPALPSAPLPQRGLPHPIWFIGHLPLGERGAETTPPLVADWTSWCQQSGVSVEVTADGAAGGADAGRLRTAVTANATLVVTGTLGETPGFPGLALAVGIARRSWVTAAVVRNAWTDPAGPGPGAGRAR
jgi:DNA polymerase (family X)